MRFAIMIVMLHSQLCFALVTGAESKGEIPDVNAHPDLTKISAILSMAEQDWRNNDYIQYLDKVESICKKLVYRRDVNTEEYTFFLETASKMLLKSYADVKPKSLKFRGYEQVANVLLSDTLVQIQTPAERFSILRSQNTRLLMVILSRAIAQKDQNWQAKPVFHNIDPPINPDNEPLLAGMAPSAIKNPEAKAAYEKAIAENAKPANHDGKSTLNRTGTTSLFDVTLILAA